jgi:phage tail-like protein
MALGDTTMVGMANRFVVVLDGNQTYNLGSWTKVEGLDVTWDVADYRAGDFGNHRWYFPANTKYTNIRLSRAACKDSDTVRKWLKETSFQAKLFDGKIDLCGPDGKPVTTWDLVGVMPAHWSIEGFNAGGSQVSLETLELTHHGFLHDEQKLH